MIAAEVEAVQHVGQVYTALLGSLATWKRETESLPQLLAMASVQDDLERLLATSERRARRAAAGGVA